MSSAKSAKHERIAILAKPSAKSAKSASPYGGDALFALHLFASPWCGSFRASTVKGNSNRAVCAVMGFCQGGYVIVLNTISLTTPLATR